MKAPVPTEDQTPPTGGIAVLIVTYGSRWHLLQRVLAAVDRPAVVNEILVVDNGAVPSIGSLVAEVPIDCSLRVVSTGENLGSAGGYARGLDAVLASGSCRHVLMLDDDNVPADGALEQIAASLDEEAAGTDTVCWMMRRHSRPELAALMASGRPVRHVANSYAGFSVRGKVLRWIRARRSSARIGGSAQLEYAPYGGLVVPLGLVRRAGLPRLDYFLYADDHEFTTRLVRSGAEIRLHPEAAVDDIDVSWHERSRTFIGSMDPMVDEHRAYYATRNRRDLERRWLRQRVLEVALNRAVYWTVVAVDACLLALRGEPRNRVITRFRTLRQALADANTGQLGPHT